MDRSTSPVLRSLLVACMLVLGFQFCVPLVVRAADATHTAEVITVGTKDPESKSGVQLDLDIPAPCIEILLALPVAGTPVVAGTEDVDRVLPALLTVTGLQPAAP